MSILCEEEPNHVTDDNESQRVDYDEDRVERIYQTSNKNKCSDSEGAQTTFLSVFGEVSIIRDFFLAAFSDGCSSVCNLSLLCYSIIEAALTPPHIFRNIAAVQRVSSPEVAMLPVHRPRWNITARQPMQTIHRFLDLILLLHLSDLVKDETNPWPWRLDSSARMTMTDDQLSLRQAEEGLRTL